MTHHCRSIPVIRSSAHNFQPISSQNCQRHRGTSDENKQSEWGKETNSYFPCAFRVYRESYVCTAGVRCGRWDLGVTSVLFPSYYRVSQVGATREEFPECMEIFHTLGELSPCGHVCCSVSLCGQELVRGEIRIFRYEIGGTWVFTVLLPCGGQFLCFPHVSHSKLTRYLGVKGALSL